jgi:hypothetical protein
MSQTQGMTLHEKLQIGMRSIELKKQGKTENRIGITKNTRDLKKQWGRECCGASFWRYALPKRMPGK